MLKGDGVRYNDGLCRCLDDQEASVVVQYWSNVEACMAPEVPGFAGGTFGMCDDFTAWWAHGRGVEVVWPVEVIPCGDVGVE